MGVWGRREAAVALQQGHPADGRLPRTTPLHAQRAATEKNQGWGREVGKKMSFPKPLFLQLVGKCHEVKDTRCRRIHKASGGDDGEMTIMILHLRNREDAQGANSVMDNWTIQVRFPIQDKNPCSWGRMVLVHTEETFNHQQLKQMNDKIDVVETKQNKMDWKIEIIQ